MRSHTSTLFGPAQFGGLGFVLPMTEEVGLGIAVLLTILGMTLHWQLSRQRIAVEEHLKEGTLTEAQANRRIRILSVCAPLATITGVALLLSIVLAYAE